MAFEDDMIEAGYSDEEEYLESLNDDFEEECAPQKERELEYDNAYDYYDEDFQPGLIKCNKNYLYDITHFEYLYRNEDFQALLLFESDMNGNKVITPDGRGKDIYYARDNYNFVKIPTSVGECILGFTSPNYNGDVYARFATGKLSEFFNFTHAMRNSGVIDYMRFEEQNSSFFDDDFFFIYQND